MEDPFDNYEDALDETGVNLVREADQGRLRPIRFRRQEIHQVLSLLDRGLSVLITGPAGAGKTAVIHGVAQAMHDRGEGGIRQLSTAQVMSGTRWIGEWQTKLDAMIERAAAQGVALYFTDVLNLRTVGSTSNDPSSFIDALMPPVTNGKVALIAEATPDTLDVIERTPKLAELFHKIFVSALQTDQVDAILDDEAGRQGLDLESETRRTVVEITTRFGAGRAQPGPALRLLDRVHDYRNQKDAIGEPEIVNRAFVERVYSIHSGLPLFVVSREATIPSREIRERLQRRIVGQRDAIEAIVEAITLFKAGLHDPARPIGSFLFVGPTGVGKTEVARAVAELVFGSEKRLLQFDLSEFKDYHSFQMLIGDPDRPEQGARLLDPVRSQPFQVLLFDELEKGHPNVADLLLQLLDEGHLTPSRGKPVSFQTTLVIATSNVGGEEPPKTLGFEPEVAANVPAGELHGTLEADFRPEFLNRFQHIVRFHALSPEQVRTIARMELDRILSREGIVARKLVVDVDESAMRLAIARGFDPRYGARALKRELQRTIVFPLATHLMEHAVDPHSVVRVTADGGATKIRIVDTEESKHARAEREPVELPDGRKLSRDELTGLLGVLHDAIAKLKKDVDTDATRERMDRLEAMRSEPGFWSDSQRASATMRDLDRLQRGVERVDRLRRQLEELRSALPAANLRRAVADLGHRAARLEEAARAAHRELIVMPAEAFWDAIVEIDPLTGAGATARNLLVKLYDDWGRDRNMDVDWIRHPTTNDEAAIITVSGHYVYGYLSGEAGLHRLREEESTSVARVRVAPWVNRRSRPTFTHQRALKTRGQFGDRIRSRVECEEGLVVQNDRAIAQNRELAAEILPSWTDAPNPPEVVVRRYDLSPFRVRDASSGITTGRLNALTPREFHRLLCARLDPPEQ